MLTAEQQAIRSTGIGASDVPAILGVDPWRGPWDVWMAKVHPSDFTDMSEAMEWGHRLEQAICDKFLEGRDHFEAKRGETMRSEELSFALATPDFLLYEDGRLVGLLEVKTSGWRRLDDWGTPGTDQIPSHYMAQVQWQMFVTGAQ